MPVTDIVIGHYVVFYCLPDPSSKIKRSFSIGRVTRLVDKETLEVRWMNNTRVTPFRGWKTWCGGNAKHNVLRKHVILCRSDNDLWHGKSTNQGRAVVKKLADAEGEESESESDDTANNAADEDNRDEEDVALEELDS
jgi:hypothetical protein